MLKNLFESLDEKVFTDELKESLETQFNEAVEIKATELAEAKIDEKITELNEAAEEFKELLIKEAEEKEAVLLENIDAFLDRAVEEFVVEATEQLETSLKNEKADLMIEAFDSILIAGGVEVSKIVESKDADDVETKLAESIEKYDNLVEENINLEKEVNKLIKMGVINEMKEGLSIVEADKFAKLADIVEFSRDAKYSAKLETIKESIKTTKVEEKLEEKKLEESVKPTTSYSHLI